MSRDTRQDFQFKTIIYEEELGRIAGWVEEYPNLETGGDLFGFWTHSGAPVVQFVLGPGNKSQHNSTSFYQDRDYLIGAGEFLRDKHGLQHIGEWHSHHQMGLAQPSGGDANTVFRALEKYSFPNFLLCIANLRADPENLRKKQIVNVGCFLFSPSRTHYRTGAWVVLPGESPIRVSLKYKHGPVSSEDPHISNWDVVRTTLDTQTLEPARPIEVSEGLWYAKPEGQALLKEIDADMKQRFPDCQMSRDAVTKKVCVSFKRNGDTWQIELPDNFPDTSPNFSVNGRKPIRSKNWTSDSKLIEMVQKCLDLHSKGRFNNELE
jgi:hypothetical protein